MARPQSGLVAAPPPATRVQVLEAKDLPMNAMSIGQFSVWIPGLAHQILQAHPGKTLHAVVGFGYLFWLMVWHGKRPRRFQPFETLEQSGRHLPAGTGDLWIYYAASENGLIDLLANEVSAHLGGLTRRVADHAACRAVTSVPGDHPPGQIWIPGSEPDFAGGCFLLQLRFHHAPQTHAALFDALHRLVQKPPLKNQCLLRALPFESPRQNGTLVLLFHQDPETLDHALETFLARPDPVPDWGAETLTADSGVRFFVPSLEVLIGLRQGGIRMNRFSPTQQWNQ